MLETLRTNTVASMLLIFPCVRLDYVSFASKTCLDYVWSVNVFMFTLWAILPPKFPFLLWLVVSLLHNWTRSPSRSCRLCLRIRVNLGPRISFWSLIFGSNFDPCFGFHFWAPFSALQFSSLAQNGPKNRTQKWYKRLSKWELILNRTVKQSTKRGNLRRFVLAKKTRIFLNAAAWTHSGSAVIAAIAKLFSSLSSFPCFPGVTMLVVSVMWRQLLGFQVSTTQCQGSFYFISNCFFTCKDRALAGKRTPKMGVGAIVIAKVNEA